MSREYDAVERRHDAEAANCCPLPQGPFELNPGLTSAEGEIQRRLLLVFPRLTHHDLQLVGWAIWQFHKSLEWETTGKRGVL